MTTVYVSAGWLNLFSEFTYQSLKFYFMQKRKSSLRTKSYYHIHSFKWFEKVKTKRNHINILSITFHFIEKLWLWEYCMLYELHIFQCFSNANFTPYSFKSIDKVDRWKRICWVCITNAHNWFGNLFWIMCVVRVLHREKILIFPKCLWFLIGGKWTAN